VVRAVCQHLQAAAEAGEAREACGLPGGEAMRSMWLPDKAIEVHVVIEPTFYVMWIWTSCLLFGLLYVAVEHL